MITACPLSYVTAGVLLAAGMLADLERASRDRRSGVGSAVR
jgi:hypothetical protein